VLVNNAGIMAAPLDRTRTGLESRCATNHLGHFALATALHDALASANNARFVSVSSRAHLCSPVDLDDINFNRRDYDPWLADGQSKTANVLFAVEATRRWAYDGITTNALHPESIWTNLVRQLTDDVCESLRTDPTAEYRTPEQGAATSVFVATSPLLDAVGGRYFEDYSLAVPYLGGPERVGVANYALDPDATERLWELSVQAIS
jgi:NAD(P)-dependent dehydrogenase (short-subunit alcohol dehydrogenase family)